MKQDEIDRVEKVKQEHAQNLKEKMKSTGDKFQDFVNCLEYMKHEFCYDEIKVIISSSSSNPTLEWSIETSRENIETKK